MKIKKVVGINLVFKDAILKLFQADWTLKSASGAKVLMGKKVLQKKGSNLAIINIVLCFYLQKFYKYTHFILVHIQKPHEHIYILNYFAFLMSKN